MAVVLITGIPGSGKTLYAVSRLKKEIEQNLALPANEQRKIYCDITGLKIENMDKPPLDWRETPPRSLLIYDEAQFHECFKPARGLTRYKQVEDLTIHRKTGHEIWFITQDPNRLHNDILAMVEQHYHLERPYGAKLATIYQYRGTEKFARRPSVKERAERITLFFYDNSLYELYESSQVDDGIKVRLPKKIIGYVAFCLCCFGLSAKLFMSDNTQRYIDMANAEQVETDTPLVTGETITNSLAQTQNLTATENIQVIPTISPEQYELTRVAMAIKTDDYCIATNSKGDEIPMSQQDCILYAEHKKPMQWSKLEVTHKHSHSIAEPINAPKTPNL